MRAIHKVRWLMLGIILLVLGNPVLHAQSYDLSFNLALNHVCFSSNGGCGYMNDAWQWCTADGTVLSGPEFTCPANGAYHIFYNPANSSVPADTMPATPTHHTITIQTVNSNAASSANTGYTYNITLENVNIDRSAYESTNVYSDHQLPGAPFDAGDDCINVNLTLMGTNQIIGDRGRNASLCYTRYDGAEGSGGAHINHWHGVTGNGKLTIGGTGTLMAYKLPDVNSGAVIGSKQVNGTDAQTQCVSNGHIVFNSGTILAEAMPPTSIAYPLCGSYAAAIGGGANCRCGDITINGGNITATAWATAAAIGAGGGISGFGSDVSGSIKITGGSVTTYNTTLTVFTGQGRTYTVYETGVGIGAGSSNWREGGAVVQQIEISGGTVKVWKKLATETEWTYGFIGGGNSNTGHTGGAGEIAYSGGRALVKVTGGKIYAANVGGGSANLAGANANGGYAELVIDMDNANDTLKLTGTIGGGNTVSGKGGNASVIVHPGNGKVYAGSIGGGNSRTGNGGDADVTVSGGSIVVSGKIGGGNSNGAGTGGNASIYVTGGTLDCGSIGGGDSSTGAPGAVAAEVSSTNPFGAGIYIAGDSKITMTSGYIGGGTNDAGDIGKATAYINVTHPESTIQGQFILCNNTSTTTDHCFFTMKAGTIDNSNLGAIGDTSHPRLKAEGGAVYMEDNYGEVTIDGGIIKNATGTLGGAIYMSNGTFSMSNGTLGGETIDDANVADSHGGALYMGGGSFEMSGGSIKYNKATHNGGGIYLANGSVSFTNGNLNGNEATTGFGGGLYLGGGSMSVSGADIKGNRAYSQGGGVHVESGSFTMTGGTIGGTIADGNYTTGEGSMGGGLYMGGGTANISGGSISGNHTDAEGYGGGIYMYGGTCTLMGGAKIGGTTTSYANSADLGGGIYSAGGIITVEGGLIENNAASSDGGGVYSNGRTAVVNIQRQGTADSYLRYNTAVRGGGIFANRGLVNFSDGDISFNHATEAGGGIYVNLLNDTVYGTLNLKGNAVLNGNYVPLGKNGGGVYLLGRVIVGESSAKTGSSARAETNYADTPGATITNANRNNIYLPNPQVRDNHTGLITVNQGGIDNYSRVGFRVESNRVPVIYCAYQANPSSYAYLDEFTTGPGHNFQNVLFDDSDRYISVHYTIFPRDRFDWDHVYLFGFWPEEVTSEPTGFALNNIDSEEDLAWLISVVNGRYTVADGTTDTTYTLTPNSLNGCTVELNADLDMSMLGWVPIGTTTKPGHANKPFKGTFHGNGHTITGISGMAYKDHYAYGLFGNVENATITDVFVKDAELYLENNPSLILGGLVGETYGSTTVGNTEVSSILVAVNAGTIVGGLIGRQNDGTVHSAIAIPDMTAGCMGGLVGIMANGNLYNSFTNAKFTELEGNSSYMGGLVAENSGTLENCYVRLRDSVPASANFGLLVGWNKIAGSMKYCYSPKAGTGQQYVAEKQGTFTDYRYYDNNTQVPYLYARRDNQVHPVEGDTTYIPVDYENQHHNPDVTTPSDKQMLLCLNNWVTAKNAETGTHPTYSGWQRPTTKVINDDLPVLMMDKAEAIAATNDNPYLYYGAVNTLIGTYISPSQAIWLYKSNDNLADNSLSDAKLYIAEHNIEGKPLTAIPADGAEVNAYVGVTLDNSAGNLGANATFGDGTADYTDWHMFSTPLNNAPLGIDYHGDGAEYGADFTFPGHPADMPYYLFYEDGRGYFPTHRYGNYGYPANDDNITDAGNAGNYYREWDFYTYYEPEYHWINFKRNWNSHWHQNAPTVKIDYNNEDTLVLGRGYLLATREPNTFLQCHGTLTEGDVSIEVTRQGYYSPGYNFLGNPYLAYLDFDKFAMKNGALFGGVDSAGYAVIDEDHEGYTYYSPNASLNQHTASQFIAPHQGFMILAMTDGEAQFLNSMRSAICTDGDGLFRGEQRPAYALVNLLANDGNGNRDIATVELGRPDKGGAPLMRDLKLATCHVYTRYEGKDWAIAFTQPDVTEVSIRFEAYADGEYTLRWDTENGDFHYLHLLDNMTGADVDCLAETEYRFHANKDDYRSRFRLVFDYTGMEEPDNNGDQVTFAYQSGDELVITGEGTLTMLDVMGRAVMSTEIFGMQTALSLPNASTGVYLLRLGTANGTKVQKIVINK